MTDLRTIAAAFPDWREQPMPVLTAKVVLPVAGKRAGRSVDPNKSAHDAEVRRQVMEFMHAVPRRESGRRRTKLGPAAAYRAAYFRWYRWKARQVQS